jgi:hypothetical protein
MARETGSPARVPTARTELISLTVLVWLHSGRFDSSAGVAEVPERGKPLDLGRQLVITDGFAV